jgi:hypothetical protein
MERLDGNAAAGLLQEVFAREMTTAIETCATCGTPEAVGAVHVYMGGPGMVLRCPSCEGVLMVVVTAHEHFHIDLSGMQRIELR